MTKKSWQEIVYSYIIVSFFAIFLSLPIIWMFSTAFKAPLDIFASPPILFIKPKFVNFIDVFNNKQFMRSLINSTITATGTVLFTMFIATPASFGFSRIKGILKTNMLTWLLLTRAAPGMVFILPYFFVYSKIGLIDTRIGLIISNYSGTCLALRSRKRNKRGSLNSRNNRIKNILILFSRS